MKSGPTVMGAESASEPKQRNRFEKEHFRFAAQKIWPGRIPPGHQEASLHPARIYNFNFTSGA